MLLIIGIVYGVCRIVIKSVQQCTYFLFSVNLLSNGVNYGQSFLDLINKILKNDYFKNTLMGISYDFDQKNYMFWKLVNSFEMMK
jgi:hypothetical protein